MLRGLGLRADGTCSSFTSEQYFIQGYHRPPYRVRLCPPLGYGSLYEECNLTRSNHRKTAIQVLGKVECSRDGFRDVAA